MATKRLRKLLVKQSKGKRFYCGKRLSFKRRKTSEKATIDHYVPKASGGKNGKSNLVASCFECNQAKGCRPAEEFLKEKIYVN